MTTRMMMNGPPPSNNLHYPQQQPPSSQQHMVPSMSSSVNGPMINISSTNQSHPMMYSQQPPLSQQHPPHHSLQMQSHSQLQGPPSQSLGPSHLHHPMQQSAHMHHSMQLHPPSYHISPAPPTSMAGQHGMMMPQRPPNYPPLTSHPSLGASSNQGTSHHPPHPHVMSSQAMSSSSASKSHNHHPPSSTASSHLNMSSNMQQTQLSFHHPNNSGHGPSSVASNSVNVTSPSYQKLTLAIEQTWIQLGNLSEAMGESDRALNAFEIALRHNPYSIPTLTSIASILRFREQFPKAAEYFQRVLNIDGNNGEIWGAVGHCYLMMDDLPKAYAAYQQALYHLPNPKEPKLWYGIGILYDRYGSFEHAEEAFSSVIKMDPKFEKANEIYFRLGIIYKQQGKYDSSLQCFHYILNFPPKPLTETDIWFQIGHVYELQKEFEHAKDSYERVLKENPNHAKVLQQLGWLYFHPNSSFAHLDTAVSFLTRSTESDANDAMTWFYLGRCYMAQQMHNKAYDAYQQAVYRDGRNPIFWCCIGVLYFQINQYRDALDAYSRAIRLNPYIGDVWFNLGTLYESCNNQVQDAIDAYTRALELDPNNSVILKRLAILRPMLANPAASRPAEAEQPPPPVIPEISVAPSPPKPGAPGPISVDRKPGNAASFPAPLPPTIEPNLASSNGANRVHEDMSNQSNGGQFGKRPAPASMVNYPDKKAKPDDQHVRTAPPSPNKPSHTVSGTTSHSTPVSSTMSPLDDQKARSMRESVRPSTQEPYLPSHYVKTDAPIEVPLEEQLPSYAASAELLSSSKSVTSLASLKSSSSSGESNLTGGVAAKGETGGQVFPARTEPESEVAAVDDVDEAENQDNDEACHECRYLSDGVRIV